MNHFQMQTPPPTRDSSSRRESYNGQQGPPYNPPSASYQGQASTPIRPPPQQSMQTPQFQTPYQPHQLQFSPEMFQYGGPASAPPMPPARYPWDQSPTMANYGNNGMMDAQQHPFGPGSSFNHAFSDWQSQNMSPMQQQGGFQQQQQHQQPQQTPMPMEQLNQNLDFWSTPAMNQQPTGSFPQETSSFASTTTTTGVNPSMIFSFSSPSQTIDLTSVRPQLTQKTVDTGGRQPYEHQMRESSREKEIAATKKSKQVSTRTNSTSSSTSLPNNGRPNLQRSNTDSGFRRVSNRSVDSQRSLQGIENIARRASPLKRNSQISLMAIPEVRSKPKTRLVIDDNGRARTETVHASSEEPIDLRKSLGFWVDDDEDSEDDVIITSQRNSFAFPSDQLKRRPSKHARTDSDPDRFDPMKRPVSSASMASLTSRLEATPIGKRSSASSSYRRASSGSFAGSLSAENMRALQESAMDEDSTDAQGALRKLMEGRRRNGIYTNQFKWNQYANQDRDQIKAILKSSLTHTTSAGHRLRWTWQSSMPCKNNTILTTKETPSQTRRSPQPATTRLLLCPHLRPHAVHARMTLHDVSATTKPVRRRCSFNARAVPSGCM
jgi:hypothetical protein